MAWRVELMTPRCRIPGTLAGDYTFRAPSCSPACPMALSPPVRPARKGFLGHAGQQAARNNVNVRACRDSRPCRLTCRSITRGTQLISKSSGGRLQCSPARWHVNCGVDQSPQHYCAAHQSLAGAKGCWVPVGLESPPYGTAELLVRHRLRTLCVLAASGLRA